MMHFKYRIRHLVLFALRKGEVVTVFYSDRVKKSGYSLGYVCVVSKVNFIYHVYLASPPPPFHLTCDKREPLILE